MNQINILIVVDTIGAIASNSLEGNVYLVDSNQYIGSWQEGTSQLHTVCQDGQILVWSVSPINLGNQVDIESFSGAMTSKSICVPKDSTFDTSKWSGRVETKGSYGSYSYTVTLSIENKTLSFDAFIKIV